jgi:preprotein translocase subunit SecG
MTTVLLVIHLILAISMVCIVLLQRSEGGALGMGGGGMGGFMTGRATSNLLTRTTAVLAACFMFTSLLLAILANNERAATSILDKPKAAPSAPAQPAAPTVPLAK